MISKKPLVSIVIPAYNCERFVAETIKSVKNQTFKDWELVIVNDKSSDKTAEVVKKFCSKKIKLINLKENSGVAKARNAGIDAARGRYLCFLDADDLWVPEKLEKQLKFMEEKKSAFSFTGYEFADENAKPNGKVVNVPARLTYKQALKNTTIWTSTVMFDLNKIYKNYVYMPLIKSEDTATWWNVLKVTGHADGLNEVLSIYRRSGKTLSSNKFVAIQRIWNLYRKHEKLNVAKSSVCFVGYAFNAVRRRV